MNLSEQKITSIQQALNTYGIAVPVTGETCPATIQGYLDFALMRALPEHRTFPLNDEQVSPALLELLESEPKSSTEGTAPESRPLTKAERKEQYLKAKAEADAKAATETQQPV